MRPNFSGVARVMGRMEEIERRIRPVQETPPPEDKDRFVDVLAREENSRKDKIIDSPRPSLPGRIPEKNPSVKDGDWRSRITDLSEKYGMDEKLVRAVIRMESGGKTDALSSKGAMGIMQLMPGTAKMLGVEDPYDPVQNLEGGIKYLSQMSDKYDGDLEKTLAAYNAGPGRVDSYGGIPPFAETQHYVKTILALYKKKSGGDDD
ncbi:MAG: lytic transglycosylase domain-containing protein [Synergistaceae bacterium]|nr:lytic transglycosylase domain-containing protein [Synergistaceae bacterium]